MFIVLISIHRLEKVFLITHLNIFIEFKLLPTKVQGLSTSTINFPVKLNPPHIYITESLGAFFGLFFKFIKGKNIFPRFTHFIF